MSISTDQNLRNKIFSPLYTSRIILVSCFSFPYHSKVTLGSALVTVRYAFKFLVQFERTFHKQNSSTDIRYHRLAICMYFIRKKHHDPSQRQYDNTKRKYE